MVLNERSWIFPVSEPESVVIWASPKIQDNAQNNQTNNSDNFDRSEDEFSFPISTCDSMSISKEIGLCFPASPAPRILMQMTTRKKTVIHTALLTESFLTEPRKVHYKCQAKKLVPIVDDHRCSTKFCWENHCPVIPFQE